jgi:hypothetical protein
MNQQAVNAALKLIFQAIERLKRAFPNRAFTIDGRLVGDVGEVIAALEYDLVLHEVSQPTHDATTADGRKVQIKATFQDALTFKTVPDYYLGLRLYPDGRHEEIFNGPGKLIYERYIKRKGIGMALLRFPVAELRRLSDRISPSERIPKRKLASASGG